MASPKPTATSYDEILRRTVASPDTSFRPSREEEQLARHRFGESTEHRPHPPTARERELLTRVCDVISADASFDSSDVIIDVDGDEIVLIGTVAGPATAIRIEELAAAVRGVRCVDNQLVSRGDNQPVSRGEQ
jgi:hypothetical protein